jgi:hypothetical protein
MIFCTAMYRKTDWKRIGGYDEKLIGGWEDWEFWINLLKNGGEVHCNEKCIFYYRVKANSMLKKLSDDKVKMVRLKKYIYKKHSECYTWSSYNNLFSENNIFFNRIKFWFSRINFHQFSKLTNKISYN